MGIESPETYGEYYWAMQIDASKALDEDMESAFASYFSSMLSEIPGIEELPAGMQNFVRVLGNPPSAGFGGFALGVGVESVDEFLHTAMNPLMKMISRKLNTKSRETWLNSQQVNTLFRQGKINEELWKSTIASEGYEDILGQFLYMSQTPYPSIPDLILYSRYHGEPDNIWGELQKWFDIPARDFPVWEWLSRQRISTLQAQQLYRREYFTENDFDNVLAQIGWDKYDRLAIKKLAFDIPNAMIIVQGDLQQGKESEDILSDIKIANIAPEYGQIYMDAILTKPSSSDLIAYELRIDPGLADLERKLRKIGVHSEYTSLYRELAHYIPPVPDLITMAVREAFTPDIAAKFGQYQDFPEEFEQFAAKKGVTKEWAQRYWAAHWSLPSVSQGFDMLHRGVIEKEELDMLLRALDVMPFWRAKLTGIAFRRLSRVDIRRMFRVGVLTEKEVYEAYLELGYNERDSKRMSDFTVKQTLATQSKFTTADIISAYKKSMLTRTEANSLLAEIGVRPENISYILATADYKKEWELTDTKIDAVRNLYRKNVLTADDARSKLLRLELPTPQVEVLMEKWYHEIKAEPIRTWTKAETLGFIEKGIITPERGRSELEQIGYNKEHIDTYLRAMQWVEKEA